MSKDTMSNAEQRLRRLGLLATLCGAVGATVVSGTARAGEKDGLWVQQYYELHQVDCARRWRDQATNPAISTAGCMGFSQGMPDQARSALAEDAKRAAPPTAKPYPQGRYARFPVTPRAPRH